MIIEGLERSRGGFDIVHGLLSATSRSDEKKGRGKTLLNTVQIRHLMDAGEPNLRTG